MKKIVTPHIVGQPRFQVSKDLNGACVIRIGSDSAVLTPRQTYDLMVCLGTIVGLRLEEIPRFPGDLGGKPLLSRLRMMPG